MTTSCHPLSLLYNDNQGWRPCLYEKCYPPGFRSGLISYFVLYDHFMCLTPLNFTKAKFLGKILLHSCFSMVRGFQNWWPYVSRPQGHHYTGLDGLKLNFVHNFSTKQHFSMKFWILATLMLKGSHVTILVKFDQILSQILVKLGQILVKIFKIPKSDIFRIQKC